MSLTKVSYSMISGKVINVFDYMTPEQIADTANPSNTTDVTAALDAAILACKSDTLGVGNVLFFPTGTFCFSETLANYGLYINATIFIRGSGLEKTVLKNLSATGAGLRTAGGTCTTVENLTINMNGSSGVGFYQAGQYSVTNNLHIRNQAVGSSNYAMVVNGSSGAVLKNIFFSNVANGIQLGPLPTNSVTFDHVIMEVSSGNAVLCEASSQVRFRGLNIETKADASLTHSRFIRVVSCQQMDFRDLAFEDSDTNILSNGEYILIENSRSINFDNVRVNHHGSEGKAFFGIGTNNNGVSVTNSLFIDDDLTTSPTYWVVQGGAVASTGIFVKNITTYCDTLVGVQTASSGGYVTIENWIDVNATSTSYLGGQYNNVVNSTGNFQIDNSTSNVISGVAGALTGTGISGNSYVNLDQIKVTSFYVAPIADNTQRLGYTGARWTEVFAANGTINTSDEREKQQIAEITAQEKLVAAELKTLIRTYKWTEAVNKKGDDARIHVGVIAQDVVKAFSKQGLDAVHYGILCFDKWDDIYEEEIEVVEGPDNSILRRPTGKRTLVQAAGDRYGIRYNELLAFIISAM